MGPHGTIVGTRTIVDHGKPTRRFDIVILAEGFRRFDLRAFDTTAKQLAAGLLDVPPFRDLAHLINVHTVRTTSTEAGVSDFPTTGVAKKTYYNVRGSFPVAGLSLTPPPSFLGTDTPELIVDAVSRVAPFETIELIIVLVNAKAFAGCTFPDQRTIFTSRHATTKELVDLVAHECGHAIAQTAEEYLDGTPPPAGKTYPNQVTEAQRLAHDVWWKSLAKKRELKLPKGDFRAVHLFGDANVTFTADTPVFSTPTSRNGMLGLYWGCQDIDPDLPGGTSSAFTDPRGRFFYRPMAECRMRKLKSPSFCRVCSHLIAERIRAATR